MGLSLRKLGSKIYDQVNMFDNNRTFKQRTPTTTESATTQAGNIGRTVYRSTKRPRQALNTNVALLKTSKDLYDIAKESVQGTDESYAKKVADRTASIDRMLKGPGLFGDGTLEGFRSTQEGKKDFISDPRKIKSTVAAGADIAQYVPVAKGFQLGSSAVRQLPKVALNNAVEGGLTTAASSATRQLAETGRVDPKQLAQETAIGASFSAAAPVAGKILGTGAKKVVSKLTPEVPKQFIINEGVPTIPVKQPLKIKAGVPIESNPLAKPRGLQIVDNNPTGFKITDNSAPRQVTGAARQAQLSKGTDLSYDGTVDPRVTARMMKDSIEGKPAVKGSALSGEGAQVPGKGLSKEAQQKLVTEARTKVSLKNNQGGYVNPGVIKDDITKAIRKITGNGTPREGLSLPQKLSPDRVIRENITNPIEQKIQKGLFNAQTSKNPIARGVGRFAQGFSKEAGVTDELLTAKRTLHGGIETGKLLREDIADAGKGFNAATKERVWASLDPEQATKTGTSLKTALTPEESVYREGLKKQLDDVTRGNLERGLITPEQAANGTYIKRGYSIFEEGTDNSKAYQQTRESLLKQFKGRKDVTNELLDSAIKDPSYLVAKKTAESNAAWAMVDYGKHLNSTGLTSDIAKPGYVQLPASKVFGEAAGKYVPKGIAEDFTGFQYNNGIISAFNDMITAYDALGIRKAKKELLTIFNPAVRLGNQFSNRAVFSNLNGINPIQFQKNMMVAKNAIKTRSPLYREAVAQGLTGLDITQADFAKRIATATGEPNLAVKAIEYAKKSYSQADDQSRLAAYITHRNRGYTAQEAARLTQRGFQDYNSVGFFYDIAAKTPLIGNAFVRFAGDATRIAKNAALDHPLRSASTIALWATFVNGMSKISGETAEDKKTREDRFGAPKLPFTDISTTVQTPWGEVNVSRFLPFYQLNDVQGAVSKLLPIAKSPVTFKDGKLGADPAAFNDPLLGQVVQLAADKDFRGKSIKDPENTGQFVDPLSSTEQKKNQAGYLAAGNLPLGREINSLYSAAKGGEDLYGKKRSLPQAAARAMGVKIEQYGPEQAKDQRGTNTYFKEKEQIDKQIKGLPAKDQEAYKRLTGYYKLREKTDNEFSPGEQRSVKAPVYGFPEDKWKEYTTSPKLYDLAIVKKEKDNATQGTPIQPEFDKRLSTEFRKQLINNKSLAPGEDVEADQRMYSNSEWDTYQKIKEEYTAAASKYYPKTDKDVFKDELVKHVAGKFPAKPPAKAAYDEAYQKFAKGQGPKPAFNDSVAAAKDKYSEDKRVWTNTERKARGLPPISKEVWDNVTFGYESDEEKVYKELKYGKGFGGYGSGGSKNISNYAGKSRLSVSTKAAPVSKGKQIARVSLKGASKTATSKPKVTVKKSLV